MFQQYDYKQMFDGMDSNEACRDIFSYGINENKTKVISADLLDLYFDFDDISMFGNISVLVTFQFW